MSGDPVVIVGAGPVGLVAALRVAQTGAVVRVLEKRNGLSRASMASTFHPATLEILSRLGVWSPELGAGIVVPNVQYRDRDAGVLAEFHLDLLADETAFPYRLHLEQAELTPILLAALEAMPNARVEFGAEVVGLTQDPDGVDLEVRYGERVETVRADVVLAADGSRSRVRDLLDIAFEGEAYATRVLRLMTPADLDRSMPGVAALSYVYHGERSCSLLRMHDCWRIIFRVPATMSDDDALDPAWHAELIAEHLPVEAEALGDIQTDIFAVGKRVAARYALGRVVLLGDAAHITNTRGGMNMNCGIHDAWTLGAAAGAGDMAALHAAAKARRQVAVNQLIPRTDRTVAPGQDWREGVLAYARDPRAARAYLREACMLDMVER